MKMYVCRKPRLMDYLGKRGIKYLSTRIDKYNPEKLVWLYDDTEELHEVIEQYYAEMPERIAREKELDK